MTETLYQRVARTGGLPEVTGPERPALLRQAAAEAARAAMARLSAAEKRDLKRAMLPKIEAASEQERLLPAAISLWCAARWDGAAPMPTDEAARRLLHRIAFDEFRPRRPTPARNRPLGPVVWAVVFGVWCLIVIGLTNSDRPRPHVLKPPAPVAVPAPAPKPTYLPPPFLPPPSLSPTRSSTACARIGTNAGSGRSGRSCCWNCARCATTSPRNAGCSTSNG